MLHLPVLRAGRSYRSLETATLTDIRSGEPVAEVSQANAGLIARDLRDPASRRRAVQALSSRELLDICKKAARLFAEGTLPAGDMQQSSDDYVCCLSSTTGMPEALCRANMGKIHFVLDQMETVLAGLTRGLDLSILDAGRGEQEGRQVSYLRQADMLGVILPSNSPGVHSLWIPSLPLKVPVVLRPGSREPWTPYRVVRALMAAGFPPDGIGFYPSGHDGAAEILLRSHRSMLFGDQATVRPWLHDPRVQIHGPGWSKVVLARDTAGQWEEHLDLMVSSIADNGGRSCINASGVWTTARGREIAEALAERLAAIPALPLDHPDARLAAFSSPDLAERLNSFIDQQLAVPGAEDVTARFRPGGRLARVGGLTFLLPTVIHCEDAGHPLARSEFLFPFAAVVETPQDELLGRMGPTLVCTALTGDPALARDLMDCPAIERLNLGPIPTSRVSWDQPHEGNLFEHLFKQRAFQAAGAGLAAVAGGA